MKISIEKINAGKAVLTLELNKKTYSQTWQDEPENGLIATSLPILEQLENDKVEYETGLVDLFDEIEVGMSTFINLCSVY
jgi:hypothetical protein